MQKVYSVGQVNNYIKNMFTSDFVLNRLYLKGEVSNCKYHSSGHIYFSLKDATGSMACVMFAGNRKGLAFPMRDGQSVIVFGAVSVYERDGRYQLYAKEIRLDGEGALYERFQALKAELEEMGMFAPEYKQKIPTYAKRIGIVTAPTGAAIRDIMNIAYRRNPYVELILYPALVQGEEAAPSIVKGIEALDELGVDTIIVGRGGGSIEDLWAFNEEIVARAIFNCNTPVISAVGHETDFTIADFVSDLRAPTPSAAAELSVIDISLVLDQLKGIELQLNTKMRDQIHWNHVRLDHMKTKLSYLSPQNQIREKRQLLIEKEDRLQHLMEKKLTEKKHQMMLYIERMKGASPLEKLSQGYSYVSDQDKKAVTSISQVKEKDRLSVYVTDGVIQVEVTDTERMTYMR